MSTALLISSAGGIVAAIGHSYLGEAKIFRPLLDNKAAAAAISIVGARRVLRAVWHIASVIWALTAIVTYGFVYHGATPPAFFAIYVALLYGFSAVGNFWGLRRVHFGAVVLAIAAGSVLAGTFLQTS